MKFKIHFTVDEYEDSFIVEADTIEEIRSIAKSELEKRGGQDAWSEELC